MKEKWDFITDCKWINWLCTISDEKNEFMNSEQWNISKYQFQSTIGLTEIPSFRREISKLIGSSPELKVSFFESILKEKLIYPINISPF